MTLFICDDADEDPVNRNRVPPLSTPRPPLRRRRRKIAQNHHCHTIYSQIRTQIPEANILKLLELKAKAFELWENKVVGAQIFSDINHLFEFMLLLNLDLRSEKHMGDSLPLTLTLPELKYPIGSEPKEKKVSINQHSTSMYISIVEKKTVYVILTRSIVTRVCLAMLLLLESILLPKNNKGTFPLEYVGTEATNETHVSPIAPQSIETPVFTPIQTQQVGTEATNETPVSPIAPQKTQHLQTSASSPLSILFENGADVEIATSDDATCRIWYPGNVFATNLCDGVEKVAVTLFADQERVTVAADKIRPKPPADDREKKFEMMDNVEAFYSKGWSSGQVIMILGENTFSVYLNSSMETLEFKASDLRIHREWLDGVNDIYSVRFNSSTEFIQFNLSDLRIPKEWVDGVWNMEKEPVVGMKRKATAQPVDHAKKGKHVVGIKRKATAQPVDRLAFLQREEKRPIVPRNPHMPLTPEHVDTAFAMLNQKRIEQSSWFSEQGIPKACFVPVQFFETVGYSYENLQKPDKKGINILKGWVGEVVRGLIRPNKMWMPDVDIVYGVVHERLVDHFIGVEIHLMENTITIFQCGVHKVKENPLIQKLAALCSCFSM
uniref:Agenet domain-containing protein n=1 Tax=Brassica oleracea TaxID=3712 RepID=A0A3P6BRT0_BRAOL|nr:unnamed protein product [Brassica oleracea]